ncbi:hypothetical protein J4Q44_G00298750 [Coregonus suidteri]|uniref:Murine leukemia virus integrase C-terminal domain-containing protein n=1 Tax=Coregonus suidteri TaxID=861788 RepID=A0AAN8QSG9_9TELE
MTHSDTSLYSHSRKAQEVPDGEDRDEIPVQIGDWVKLKVHKRKWNQPRWMGPYQVIQATPNGCQSDRVTGMASLVPLPDDGEPSTKRVKGDQNRQSDEDLAILYKIP